MDTYRPFTYLIGWSHLDKWYYGVRYAKGCNPGQLWVSYFTSSKVVRRLRKEHGEPDIIQVRRVFHDRDSAIRWERVVLRRLKVNVSARWLNMIIPGIGMEALILQPAKVNEKRSDALRGHKRGPEEAIKRLTTIALNRQNGIIPKKRSYTCEQMDRHREQARERVLKQGGIPQGQKQECSFCMKLVDPGNFRKYHGENCKMNPDIGPEVLIQRSEQLRHAASFPRPNTKKSSIKNDLFSRVEEPRLSS